MLLAKDRILGETVSFLNKKFNKLYHEYSDSMSKAFLESILCLPIEIMVKLRETLDISSKMFYYIIE